MIATCLPGKELAKFVNVDEVVAEGAAIQAGILSGSQFASDLLLVDVAP